MSLLRLFGDSVLNYLKKIKQSIGDLQKQLRFALFFQPIAILVMSFFALIVTTNLFLNYFIDSQVDQRIQQQFLYLDQKYSQENGNPIEPTNLFEATYAILDEKSEVVYASNGLDNEYSQVHLKNILGYLKRHKIMESVIKENHNAAQSGDAQLLEVGDDHYFFDVKSYQGQLESYYIKKAASGQAYKVVTYVRTTPLIRFVVLINCVLILLSLIICLLAWRKYFVSSNKLRRSFEQIEDNLIKTGNRQLTLPMEKLDYNEFNLMQSTIEKVDGMIAASEERQKQFFQNASHELRTPLMSIQGYAESIVHELSENPHQAALVIYEESQRMKELVNEILLLSRLDSQLLPLSLETLSLTDLIYDITWALKAESQKRHITFEHNFDNDYVVVNANEDYLKTALSNIMTNALRYAKSRIVIRVDSSIRPIELAITNDGEAIDSRDLPHIFERFYKGKGGQTGIGLALTKEIIEKHFGSVSVTSTEKETTFLVKLP